MKPLVIALDDWEEAFHLIVALTAREAKLSKMPQTSTVTKAIAITQDLITAVERAVTEGTK